MDGGFFSVGRQPEELEFFYS